MPTPAKYSAPPHALSPIPWRDSRWPTALQTRPSDPRPSVAAAATHTRGLPYLPAPPEPTRCPAPKHAARSPQPALSPEMDTTGQGTEWQWTSRLASFFPSPVRARFSPCRLGFVWRPEFLYP